VNEGEDWKDVQIPGSSSAAPKATEKKVKKAQVVVTLLGRK